MFARCTPRARRYTYVGTYNYWGASDVQTACIYILGGFCTAVQLVGARFVHNYNYYILYNNTLVYTRSKVGFN